MIIGTCGYGSTGSSAVSDFLKEFECNNVLDDFEFYITYLPDGLQDLDYHLNVHPCKHEGGAVSIRRFRRFVELYCAKGMMTKFSKISKKEFLRLTDEFIDSLVLLRWKTINRTDKLLYDTWFYRFFGCKIMAQRVLPRLNKICKKSVDLYPVRNVDFSITPENFNDSAQKYISNILKLMGADFSKNIVLDQPFLGENPEASFKFYTDPYAIVVDRDPRDVYLFMKKFLYKKKRFIPCDNVEDFVLYYKKLRTVNKNEVENSRILRINFEDMVYKYDITTKKICDFCHLSENEHVRKIFIPEKSMANTRLFLRWPEYSKDIKYIEENLSEYLYDFSNCPEYDINKKMFMGKAEVNNEKNK